MINKIKKIKIKKLKKLLQKLKLNSIVLVRIKLYLKIEVKKKDFKKKFFKITQ